MLALAVGVHAAAPVDRAAAFRAAFKEIRSTHAIPALSVGVIDHGEIIFIGAFGNTNGRPVTELDRFRAASISKLLTAQAIVKLAEERRLMLDDDIGHHLPAFAQHGITLRQLLTHTSGLRDAVRPMNVADRPRVDAYVTALAVATAPKSSASLWRYTDADYNLLGAVVEKVSGIPFAEYVEKNFLRPLAMNRSTLFPPPGQRDDVLPPHFNYGIVMRTGDHPYDVAFAPSEGLVTNIGDLTTWVQAVLRKDPRLLTPQSFELMLSSDNGPGAPLGLGWQMSSPQGREIAQHGGSLSGYRALVLTYPRQQRGIVILANADHVPRWDIARVADAILDGRDFLLPPSPQRRYALTLIGATIALVLGAWFGARLIRRKIRKTL